jgi:hypothetical protein
MNTRRSAIVAGLAIVGILAGSAGITAAGSHKDRTLLKADMLVGVSAPYTGATNAIRGVPGGGAPWVIAKGEIELKASGKVEMEVHGLVIDPAFPNPAVAGINPVPMFKVTVSCLSKDATGAPVTVNVSTDPAAANTAGNSELEGMVSLPSPCFAPIVFVANGVATSNGAWFAVTGG